MNIDLKKKKDSEFSDRMAYKAANFLKDMAEDGIDYMIDADKHSFGNKIAKGLVKVLHNTYVDEYNLAPKLKRAPDEEQHALPATIKKVEQEEEKPPVPHSDRRV